MMLAISPEQNARAGGRDCVIDWAGPGSKMPTVQTLRESARTIIISFFETGRGCDFCATDAAREEFDRLLTEWERGFDEAAKVLYGAPQDRVDAIKAVAVRANIMCSMLNVANILPESARLGNLRTCVHLASEIADDLLMLVGGEA